MFDRVLNILLHRITPEISQASPWSYATKYSRMGQVKFVEGSLWSDMVCLSSTSFTWYILEYFAPYNEVKLEYLIISQYCANTENFK